MQFRLSGVMVQYDQEGVSAKSVQGAEIRKDATCAGAQVTLLKRAGLARPRRAGV